MELKNLETRIDELMEFLKDNMVTKREFKRALEDIDHSFERVGQKIDGIHNRLDEVDDKIQVLDGP